MYREYHTKSPSSKRERHRNKCLVLRKYGTKCAYCGTDKYEVLAVDHVNDDGQKDRVELNKIGYYNGSMWRYLAKAPYQPDKYQILCHNCNIAKYQYGLAPHRKSPKPIEWWEDFSRKIIPKRCGGKLKCGDCGTVQYYPPYYLGRMNKENHRCLPCRMKNHIRVKVTCGVCGAEKLLYRSDIKRLSTDYRCHLHRKGRRNATLRK